MGSPAATKLAWGRAGARKCVEFSPTAETERHGLCDGEPGIACLQDK
ncbi:MAG: hypothetical protein IJO88_01465 [Oscillospiraceae bacterium]|nr:hypothetical protein [Oscillospiraceae bacterium]